VLVVVLLSLVNLLSESSLVVDEGLEDRKLDGLKEHTGELTPKVLVTREHGHDASVDGLSNPLLLGTLGSCGGGLSGGGLGLLLLDLSLLLHLHLHLGLLLHLALLLVQTTALARTVVIRALVLGLTREHLTLDVRIHVGREAVEHVRGEHLLTVHATHAREEALLAVLGLEHGVTVSLLLSESKEERLAVEEVVHDLLDGLRGRLGGGEVTETEALAGAIGVPHDDAALDVSEVLEEVAKILVSDRVSKVADVHVGLGGGLVVEVTLVLLGSLTLVLLLSAVDVHLGDSDAVLLELLLVLTFLKRADEDVILPLEGLAVHGLLGLDGVLVLLEVDETEAAALTTVVQHDDRGSDLTESAEELGDIVGKELLADVLHIHICVCVVGVVGTKVLGDELLSDELLTEGLEHVLVGLAGLESLEGVLDLLELDKTVAEAGAVILGDDLAGGDSTKVREDILKLDESNALVEALDEQVTFVALTLRGVTTRPHDTAGLALEGLAVEGIKGLLSVLGALEVDVGVAERVLILHITADTDGQDGTAFLECVVDIRLTDIVAEVTNVEGAVGIGGGGGNGGRLLSRHLSVQLAES